MTETVKSDELVGRRVTLEVHDTPCNVSMGAYEPLRETTSGTVKSITSYPGGPIGVIEADDGRSIAFDAGLDLRNGRVRVVLED
jgi:hypothetical protein